MFSFQSVANACFVKSTDVTKKVKASTHPKIDLASFHYQNDSIELGAAVWKSICNLPITEEVPTIKPRVDVSSETVFFTATEQEHETFKQQIQSHLHKKKMVEIESSLFNDDDFIQSSFLEPSQENYHNSTIITNPPLNYKTSTVTYNASYDKNEDSDLEVVEYSENISTQRKSKNFRKKKEQKVNTFINLVSDDEDCPIKVDNEKDNLSQSTVLISSGVFFKEDQNQLKKLQEEFQAKVGPLDDSPDTELNQQHKQHPRCSRGIELDESYEINEVENNCLNDEKFQATATKLNTQSLQQSNNECIKEQIYAPDIAENSTISSQKPRSISNQSYSESTLEITRNQKLISKPKFSKDKNDPILSLETQEPEVTMVPSQTGIIFSQHQQEYTDETYGIKKNINQIISDLSNSNFEHNPVIPNENAFSQNKQEYTEEMYQIQKKINNIISEISSDTFVNSCNLLETNQSNNIHCDTVLNTSSDVESVINLLSNTNTSQNSKNGLNSNNAVIKTIGGVKEITANYSNTIGNSTKNNTPEEPSLNISLVKNKECNSDTKSVTCHKQTSPTITSGKFTVLSNISFKPIASRNSLSDSEGSNCSYQMLKNSDVLNNSNFMKENISSINNLQSRINEGHGLEDTILNEMDQIKNNSILTKTHSIQKPDSLHKLQQFENIGAVECQKPKNGCNKNIYNKNKLTNSENSSKSNTPKEKDKTDKIKINGNLKGTIHPPQSEEWENFITETIKSREQTKNATQKELYNKNLENIDKIFNNSNVNTKSINEGNYSKVCEQNLDKTTLFDRVLHHDETLEDNPNKSIANEQNDGAVIQEILECENENLTANCVDNSVQSSYVSSSQESLKKCTIKGLFFKIIYI